jgi:hypothetical protein
VLAKFWTHFEIKPSENLKNNSVDAFIFITVQWGLVKQYLNEIFGTN